MGSLDNSISNWSSVPETVEFEQRGAAWAEYGAALLKRLSAALTCACRRGFSGPNLESMRLFNMAFPSGTISQTTSGIFPTVFELVDLTGRFPLSWSHSVLPVRHSRSAEALDFYTALPTEAMLVEEIPKTQRLLEECGA
jgi:hypothetical protein